MEIKRIKLITILFILLFLIMACRLWYIQIFGHEELSEAMRKQSLISLEGSNTRGIIYDRNGEPLVADDLKYIYIIKKDDYDVGCEKMLRTICAKEVSNDNEEYQVFSSENYNKIVGKRLIKENNAYILQASARYDESQTAEHLIGYINKEDTSGAAGLELMYDEELAGLNRKVYAVSDVKGNLIRGRGLIITSENSEDSYIKEGIRTNIDKGIQGAVEEIIEDCDYCCGVVVSEISTGGVVAMASTPRFDPRNVEKYIAEGGDCLLNKVTQGEYAPGSVFKVVVSAAAIEGGFDIDKKFNCAGRITMSGLSIGCETGGETGHGQIDLGEAFAQSCNCYFVQLAQEIGSARILEMAHDMGFGEKALDGYPQEAAGYVMDESQSAGDAIGNLAIGQAEMLVTPIQVNKMTKIIASGGKDGGLHLLVDEEEEERQIIMESTAEKIGKMMEAVSREGTARNLELIKNNGNVSAAVKTGTAEYVANSEGEISSHGWITGYSPAENPEYAITVFVENGGSGAMSAGPIFKKILDYLEESGAYSQPTFA